MKRNTSRHLRRQQRNVLEARVFSPRIAWLAFIRCMGWVVRCCCVLAVLGGIGWGVWLGMRHAFHDNPDFRLRLVDLNPNPVIDEMMFIELCGIDLSSAPNLFDIDVSAAEDALRSIPAVATASVERDIREAALLVRVTARTPRAWVCDAKTHAASRRAEGSLLVDADGFAYPCPAMQVGAAAALPVIELPEAPIAGAHVNHPDLAFCMRLLDVAAETGHSTMIDVLRRPNEWSLELLTTGGITATCSLGDRRRHSEQLQQLARAIDHAKSKGYEIATINLIPRNNIPLTTRSADDTPPRAIPISTSASTNGNAPPRAIPVSLPAASR
jgi:hypothetical protein